MIKIGIVGAGIIGIEHKKAIMKNSDCTIAAICDLDIEKAKSLSEGTDAAIYTDYKEMCKNESLDAVILNLPHFLHKDVTIYFLNHKIAVLTEKPMANTVEQCDEMAAAAKQNNVPFAIGHVQRYYACYRKLRELIRENKLGKLCQIIEVRNVDYVPGRPKWFLSKEQSGGGILMNYGAHTLDKVFYTTGLKVQSVAANGSNFLTSDNVETAAQLLVTLTGGVSAVFSYCGTHVPSFYETNFYFTDGAAKVRDGIYLWIAKPGGDYEKVDLDYETSIFDLQLKEFVKLLRGEESEIVTPEYGREIISVLQNAFGQF